MITHLGSLNIGKVRAVTSVSNKIGYDFAKHDKPLGKPSKQRLGEQLEEWRLGFNFNYYFCDPQTLLEEVKAICAKGEPIQLVFDYLKYQGWVTLDNVNVTYQEVAPNGKPTTITGTISLSEYVGDTTQNPEALAVRNTSDALTKPMPVQAASGKFGAILDGKQPLQQLSDALIAQHKARALLRNINHVADGDYSSINSAIRQVNGFFTSDGWQGNSVTDLPVCTQNNITQVIEAIDSRSALSAGLACSVATRIFR